MLLTAQRILSPVSGQNGVNVYQYLHGPYHWDQVPDEFLPDVNPGELVEDWLEVRPGGNRVVSYLDFVAPDELEPLELHQRLASLKHHFVEDTPTQYWDQCWVRFGHAQPIPWKTELGALAGHILLCVSGQRGP